MFSKLLVQLETEFKMKKWQTNVLLKVSNDKLIKTESEYFATKLYALILLKWTS